MGSTAAGRSETAEWDEGVMASDLNINFKLHSDMRDNLIWSDHRF